jgi:hypothetical protein
MKIGFLTNQLGLRGTETTLWGYAHYYEEMYSVQSYILVRKETFPDQIETSNPDIKSESVQWFTQRFENRVFILPTNEINDWLLKNKIEVCLVECGGYPGDFVPTSIPTIVHSVFNTTIPMGTIHTAISKYLIERGHPKVKLLPNILYLENHLMDLRGVLKIPKDARVFGRYGGFHQFDIQYVREAILETASTHPNIYFIFMNTALFLKGSVSNIMFFEGTPNLSLKRAFINTCDAMIHARSDGETFGCAIGEFALCQKPILTSTFHDNAHLELLGPAAYLYQTKEQLKEWFIHLNLKEEKRLLHSYWDYVPEKVIPILDQYVEEAKNSWFCNLK